MNRAASVLMVCLSCLSVAACTAFVDTSTIQCREDDDCRSKGAAFAGTVCTADHVCGHEACTSHADCTRHFDPGGYCRPSDSTCVNAFTESCTELVPSDALSRDDSVLVGFMGPLTDTSMSYGEPLKEGALLALSEIENPSGLPAVKQGDRPRKFAMLVCHDGQIESARLVARHLAEEVRVPAIIGPAFSKILAPVASEITVRAGTLLVSPSATSPSITDLPDDHLVWRTVPSDVIQAKPLALLVGKVEALLRSQSVIAREEPLRLAVVWKDDTWGRGISDAVLSELREGKLSVNSPIKYADPAVDTQVDWNVVAERVLEVRPHVIVGLGTDEFGRDLLPRVEAKLAALLERDASTPAPRYLLPEGARLSDLSATVTAQPGLSARILGTAPGPRSSPSYGVFADRFRSEFGKVPGNLAEFAYDAAYLLAYAIAWSRRDFPTGVELAEALSHMSCKGQSAITIRPGPSGYAEGFTHAAQNRCVDYDGVSGPLDFADDTDEADGDMAIWCPEGNDFSVLSDAWYSAGAGTLMGAAHFCL